MSNKFRSLGYHPIWKPKVILAGCIICYEDVMTTALPEILPHQSYSQQGEGSEMPQFPSSNLMDY